MFIIILYDLTTNPSSLTEKIKNTCMLYLKESEKFSGKYLSNTENKNIILCELLLYCLFYDKYGADFRKKASENPDYSCILLKCENTFKYAENNNLYRVIKKELLSLNSIFGQFFSRNFTEEENYEKTEINFFDSEKPKEEFYINILISYVMNEKNRKKFSGNQKKLILLPGCMRKFNNGKCMASETPEGLLCRKCSDKCNVRKYSEIYDIRIIPHGKEMKAKYNFENYKSVVGVACISELAEGGYLTEVLGLCSQCVLLTSQGCKNWNKEEMTDIDSSALKETMNAE